MSEQQGIHENGGITAERMQRVKERVIDYRNIAMDRVSDTPGWVWAVVGGVALLVVGLLAANRYRGYRQAAPPIE